MKYIINNMKCPSVNEMYKVYYKKRAKLKKEIQEIAYYEILKSGRKQFTQCRITLTASYKTKKRRDCDNLYAKPFIDALVASGVITDDNSSVVRSVTLVIDEKVKEDRVIIEIN